MVWWALLLEEGGVGWWALRNTWHRWEQGHFVPAGPARVLLAGLLATLGRAPARRTSTAQLAQRGRHRPNPLTMSRNRTRTTRPRASDLTRGRPVNPAREPGPNTP